MQWSRSAGLASGPFLSMIRIADSCVRIVIFADVVEPVPDARMQLHRALDRGLRVELRGKADLEQHVLHHVAAVGPLELNGVALEQHVVETPGLRGQDRRVAHLAGLRDQREAHGARGGVAGGPALARAGVRRVAVGAQALAVDPRERHRVDDLVAATGRACCATTAVEATLTSTTWSRPTRLKLFSSAITPWISCALIMPTSTSFIVSGAPARGDRGARQPVGRREDAAEVVRRVAPLGGEPRVVEVEPADHRADVERGLHRIELERRARHLRPVRHDGARDDRPEELRARRIGKRLEAAAQRVDQAVARACRAPARDPVWVT